MAFLIHLLSFQAAVKANYSWRLNRVNSNLFNNLSKSHQVSLHEIGLNTNPIKMTLGLKTSYLPDLLLPHPADRLALQQRVEPVVTKGPSGGS